eukprot:m.28552 g.28552  ORF g.28552 m.28552 type:complete len:251 (+) comp10458_c0_seq1:175-927(+)
MPLPLLSVLLSAGRRAVVLVHGAWYGGWCWRDVVQRLHAQGFHRVFSPCLTGLGSRSHLLDKGTGLNTHITDVCNLIETEELKDITLVGHSYGGMVATGVADRLSDRIKNLFFLDAYTPSHGQSAMAIRSAKASPNVVVLDLDPKQMTIPPSSPEHHGLSGEKLAWALRHLCPQPRRAFDDNIELSGKWLQVPNKVYFRATQFPAFYFDDYYEHWAADSTWRTYKQDVSHNHMMMDPDWFVNLLRDADCL